MPNDFNTPYVGSWTVILSEILRTSALSSEIADSSEGYTRLRAVNFPAQSDAMNIINPKLVKL